MAENMPDLYYELEQALAGNPELIVPPNVKPQPKKRGRPLGSGRGRGGGRGRGRGGKRKCGVQGMF